MSQNWKPSERFYELTEAKGIPREWISHQLPEIKLYWIERGVARCWDLTVLNWIKRAWEQVDKSRYYRSKQNVIENPYTPATAKVRNINDPPEPPSIPLKIPPLSKCEVLSLEARTAIADTYMKELKI